MYTKTLQQYRGLHLRVTRLLSATGVKMLAGSDTDIDG